MPAWIRELVEWESFGDSKVLVIAPHEGTCLLEKGGMIIRIGERGTAELARLAARHVGGTYLASHVPRIEADFARDPALLGEGAEFRIRSHGRRVVLRGHTNTAYAGLLERFHSVIEEAQPSFILDFHRMAGTRVDIRLGFGAERQYIGGTERALQFKRDFLEKCDPSLEVWVSKVKLAGESEFILNHYSSRAKTMLVEFSSKRGFRMSRGEIKEEYRQAARAAAETAREWIDK